MIDGDLCIHSIEALAVDIPLARNFGGSTYAVLKRSTVITRLRTEGGLVSEVYNGDNREHGREIVKIIETEITPLLIGEDASAYERIWAKIFPISTWHKARGVAMEAIACVDTAIWDLNGKRLGTSVSKLLGGYRDSLPIIAIGGYYQEGKTLNDLAREMDWLRSVGMAGCKVKVGGLSPEKDLERVKAALLQSSDNTRKQQSAGWRVYKALEPGANNSVLYVFWLNPVVKGADYTVSKILVEAFPDEAQELYRKFSGAYSGGQTLVNLQLLSNLGQTA